MADKVARFLEDAKAELLDALAYYNRRTPGAGDRLLEDVLETAEQICETPLRWPIEDDGYRRWRLLVFPYGRRQHRHRRGRARRPPLIPSRCDELTPRTTPRGCRS